GPGSASQPRRRPRHRQGAPRARRTAGLPRWRKFPRRGNIDSPPVITGVTTARSRSLIERLNLLERLLQVLDEHVAVPPQVALVPGADEVREEPVEVVHVGAIQRLLGVRVNRPAALPPAVLVIVLPFTVFERNPEVDLSVCLDLVT